jgi:hypothetical protein
LSSGTVDPDDHLTQEKLIRELQGLYTMHEGDKARIFRQDDFQPDSIHFDLVEKAGLPAELGRI